MSNQKKYHLFNGTKKIGIFTVADILQVTLFDNLKMIDTPAIFHTGYSAGQRVFEGDIVKCWVRNRVVPSGRQNIQSILKEMGIVKYDELAIFLYCNGKFSQDDFRLEEKL